jgi:hypothetical protein
MKTSSYNRVRHRVTPRDTIHAKNENKDAQTFFSVPIHKPFFRPAFGFGQVQPVQRKCTECEKEDKVQPKNDPMQQQVEKEDEMAVTPTFSQRDIMEQNTRHFANCDGVTVQGHTDANYGNSYSSPGSSTPSKDCDGCSDEDCVTNTGTVVSVFTTNPQITLPSVPAGLSECEAKAVENFINTTLMAHEQQHVAAFNTYRGTVKTPYTYKGCASGLDAHTRQIHDNIEAARKIRSDAKSAALDANGANIFHITCECPDPEPEADAEAESN